MKKFNGRNDRRSNALKVQFNDGTEALVLVNTIPDSVWNTHHGRASDGTDVRSAKTYTPKGSRTTLIKNGRGDVIAMDNAELEILIQDLIKTFDVNTIRTSRAA